MAQAAEENLDNSILTNIQHLKPECEKCFGLCCVALYFSKPDGFPTDKKAGTPCPHLAGDFRCAIHEKLSGSGLKGCVAYECFGAGQQVSQVTFGGRDWRTKPELTNLMFETFLSLRQLHEMCWYLTQVLSFKLGLPIDEEIREGLNKTEEIAKLPPLALKEYNLLAHGEKMNSLLQNASKLKRYEISRTHQLNFNFEKKSKGSKDFFGKDLREKDLRCADLQGACLIAANLEGVDLSGADLIGADLRDANVRGANLSLSIFLTQSQINTAKGNLKTKLPLCLSRPNDWDSYNTK